MVVGHTSVKRVGCTVNNDHQQICGGTGKEKNGNVRIVQGDQRDKSGMNCWKVDRLIDVISYNCIVNIFHLNPFEWKGGVGSFSHWE